MTTPKPSATDPTLCEHCDGELEVVAGAPSVIRHKMTKDARCTLFASVKEPSPSAEQPTPVAQIAQECLEKARSPVGKITGLTKPSEHPTLSAEPSYRIDSDDDTECGFKLVRVEDNEPIFYDTMEPEDARLHRDLKPLVDELNRVADYTRHLRERNEELSGRLKALRVAREVCMKRQCASADIERNKTEAAETQVAELKDSLSGAVHGLHHYKNRVAELTRERDEARRIVETRDRRINAKDDEILSLTQQVAELEAKLGASERALDRFRGLVAQRESELKTLREQLKK